MKWNLRLAAANRGIWKASELQRLLAERGMVISAGKMSGLWSGQPNTVKLDELDVICAVLGCDVGELLLPDPVAVPEPTTGESSGAARGGSRRHAQAPDRPVPASPVTGRSAGGRWPGRRGLRVGRADVTRRAEHVTPQMLLQRCDSPLLLAATRCAIGLSEARGWSAATLAGVFTG